MKIVALKCGLLGLAAFAFAFAVQAEEPPIDFGNNTGDYVDDDLCDDPRFVGADTAPSVDWGAAGLDANDCKAAARNGARFWYDVNNLEQVDCETTDFGNDTSDDAEDGECDDPRFFGFGVSSILMEDDKGRDASDCAQACKVNFLFSRPAE